jgi:phenylalanyl-tRNA synthetase beta chain
VVAFELRVEALVRHGALVPRYHPIPSLPAVLRDLAVVVAEPVTAEAVLAAVREEPLVEAATLFDVYRGAPIPAGRKNLALAIRYRAADRQAERRGGRVPAGGQAAPAPAHQRIVARLAERLDAELRG